MKDVRPKMTEAARDALDKMHHEMGFQTRSDSILAFYNEKKIDALDSATQRKTSAENLWIRARMEVLALYRRWLAVLLGLSLSVNVYQMIVMLGFI